jgi:hypothetical protein
VLCDAPYFADFFCPGLLGFRVYLLSSSTQADRHLW